ncbi:hypothetical protein R5R73_14300 [Salinicola sp. LHM]|jgi:tetratricopeptide (TPR) repeat protein|uniref:hypothetical protein n=1 Tax=Salinicola sp. LHM TaxID=3065298 RepID=UPI002ACF0776|nr:hypothetical protein [Salinicola sp. LHM]MEC8916269.1 hypothetical protein [Pseudomonadota bacterium]MED5499931.1 hypothetical protein [Pseudomonadota bacterium]WQH32201.1 hypothetical protein R5R73_14300 [Salinicola sp. LHM]
MKARHASKAMILAVVVATMTGLAPVNTPAALASDSSTPSASTADSATAAAGLHELQSRWANIQYQTPEARRADAFEQLYQRAQALLKAQPQSAELHTWAGIIRGSQAGAEGGLSALSQVKDARAEFEQALAIDPTTLDGSAYTSLGTLYHQVPGWPISFGDDDKARQLLQKGLSLNPDGIDSNYFWADFLHDQGDDAQARQALEKAMAAAPRPGRETADAGRRQEIQALLSEI